MRIGLLYICIGKYSIFWKDFYLSAERYFFQDRIYIREYYVFTDSPSIYGEKENEHIHRICQQNLGWPDNTLMRFHMFMCMDGQLRQETDYLFFFNANMEFKVPIGKEILPSRAENDLVGAKHPWMYNLKRWNWTYERRHKSSVYVSYNEGEAYFQGSVWGGATAAILRLCEVCRSLVDKDKSISLTPRWHDESVLNRYFIDNPPKKLDCSYNYPEMLPDLPFDIKILGRDKEKYFSLEELGRGSYQGSTIPFSCRLYEKVMNLLNRIVKE